jgi:hypothetical protein
VHDPIALKNGRSCFSAPPLWLLCPTVNALWAGSSPTTLHPDHFVHVLVFM